MRQLLLAPVLLASMVGYLAHGAGYAEAEVKATYLYHFFHFIQWPEQGSQHSGHKNFCSLDRSEVFKSFEAILKKRKDANISVNITVIKDAGLIHDCDFVFVSGESEGLSNDAFVAVHGKPVLLVGDYLGFAESGGAIEIYREENRIKVKINAATLHEHGLTASSQLLKLATIINISKGDAR